MKRAHQRECAYCKGQGYFQLLLGGTEDCPKCGGEGSDDPENPPSAVGPQRKP